MEIFVVIYTFSGLFTFAYGIINVGTGTKSSSELSEASSNIYDVFTLVIHYTYTWQFLAEHYGDFGNALRQSY